MVYDPCAPHIPPAPFVPAARASHHHPVHRLIGRRVSRWHGPTIVADACLKTGQKLRKPAGLIGIVSPLFDPGVLTVAGMAVVGTSAFGGAILPNIMGTTVIIPGVAKPPHHTGPGGKGTPTPVPEPGTAAILAVAMVVVLISAWFQGGRALRQQPQSRIESAPLPKRRRVPAQKPPAASVRWVALQPTTTHGGRC